MFLPGSLLRPYMATDSLMQYHSDFCINVKEELGGWVEGCWARLQMIMSKIIDNSMTIRQPIY